MQDKQWMDFLEAGEFPHRDTLRKWLKDPERTERTILALALSPQLTHVELLINAIPNQPHSRCEDILAALLELSDHFPEELIMSWCQAPLASQAALRPILAQMKHKQKHVVLLGEQLKKTS